MWEKIRVIFTIPELRQKILLTLLFLTIYRVGWQITLPIFDQKKMEDQLSGADAGGLGSLLKQATIFSASQISQVTIFGLGIMPYISASIIFQLLASVYPPLEKLQKEGESGRKKINEYTRYATVLLCLGQSWGYIAALESLQLRQSGVLERQRPLALQLATHGGAHHDRRHHLPHVARRADRRVRHRQRHQLADHGRHSRPHAPRRLRPDRAHGQERRRVGQPDGPGKNPRPDAALRGRGGGRRAHQPGPAPHPHAKRQARPRPPRLRRRQPAVPAPAGEPGRRHAHHLRQQPLALPHVPLQLDGSTLLGRRLSVAGRPHGLAERLVPPRPVLHLQHPLRGPDLLLLLLLDGHYLQPQGHVRQPEETTAPLSPAIVPDGGPPITWKK